MGKTVTIKRPDGKECTGYYEAPASAGKAPGVVVIQEWWGLNEQIKGVADRLAEAGYRTLVPDLYRGKLALEANEAEHLMNGLDFADAASQDIRGAVQYLKSSGSTRVGVTGYCMGGALTVLSSVFIPELDASVIWYGYPPLEYVDAEKIKIPIMGHWATRDEFFDIGGVDQLEQKLKDAGVEYTFHRYDAKHAFANETADTVNLPVIEYDKASADLAWERTVEFFNDKLA